MKPLSVLFSLLLILFLGLLAYATFTDVTISQQEKVVQIPETL